MNIISTDTICALSTPSGSGAIGVIRLSGAESISICNSIFKGKNLSKQQGQSLHFGKIVNENEVIDEVLVSIFKGPNSYTGENTAEISCHGSAYILGSILDLLILRGARLAKPGEFTQRAFLNGKMDLTQAEAVADLIASESKAAHGLAMNQMRGGFSKKIAELRKDLIQFTALIELELDFGEEDVEFADRSDLKKLVDDLLRMIRKLISSFSTGNVLKNGIPVAIVGEPNVGKSTLLNALLNEDKAIVSEIAGTTRDSIEDVISLGGTNFRFIDTAGIRETSDVVENIGINRTFEKISSAMIVLYLVDVSTVKWQDLNEKLNIIQEKFNGEEKKILVVLNKIDKIENLDEIKISKNIEYLKISALREDGVEHLSQYLIDFAQNKIQNTGDVIVSNARHLEALKKTEEALSRVEEGLSSNITGDFLAMDIRQGLYQLGEITGSIDVDRDILGTIFGQFCIGK